MITYKSERNPILTYTFKGKDGVEQTITILCIGDPHFGKKFNVGVPSHRVGEREQMILNEFKRLLSMSVDYIVIVGDLFDKFVVSPTILMTVVEAIKDVKVPTYIIPGNHDLSKDKTKISTFKVFTDLVKNIELVNVITNNTVIDINENLKFFFDCYDPFNKNTYLSTDMADKLKSISSNKNNTLISFGHWDSMDLTDNGYLPIQDLLDYSDLTVSGHEHSYRDYIYPFDKNKNKFLFTGSLQPYSHAEDVDNILYKTINYADLSTYNLSTDFKYKCLRVISESYFALDEPIDCLSFTCKLIAPAVEEELQQDAAEDVDSYFTMISSWLDNYSVDKELKEELTTILKEKSYL